MTCSKLCVGRIEYGPARISSDIAAEDIERLKSSFERLKSSWSTLSVGSPGQCLRITPPQPTVLWGFFHSDCIYESAAALVSLHRTKAGAWRAMRRAQWEAWEGLRDRVGTHVHAGPFGRLERGAKAYDGQRSHIGAVEVLP